VLQCLGFGGSLRGGQTYTLIVSHGKLAGTFGGITNGQVVPIGACDPLSSGQSYGAVIRYNTKGATQTVTATLVGAAQIKTLLAQSLATESATASIAGLLGRNGYPLRFERPTAGQLTSTWTTVSNRHRVTVAQATWTGTQVGPATIRLRLTPAGKALLRRATGVAITATATFAQSGVQKPITVSTKFLLSQRRPAGGAPRF